MQEDSEITKSDLRNFAFIMASALVLLFGLLIPWLLGDSYPLWPWIVSVMFVFGGGLAPASLKPFYHVWIKLGLVLHKITTPIVLGVVFFIIMLPISILLRLLGKTSIHHSYDYSASTYRIPSEKIVKESFRRTF